MKSFTEHFIRVWIHTSKISKVSRNISYVYEFIRRRFHTRIKSNAFEKIRVCKIPWMILHNDTRIKSYTYEKLHVWTVTRMKNYTYEKLHVLNIEFWLVHCYTRIDSFTELLIRVCFLTWNFSYVEPLALFVHFGQPYLSASRVKLLGVIMDDRLQFNDHISAMCCRTAWQLNALTRISKHLDSKSKHIIYNGFMASNFNYCPLVWHFCGLVDNNKLEKLQERSLRIIHNDYELSFETLLKCSKQESLLTKRLKIMI